MFQHFFPWIPTMVILSCQVVVVSVHWTSILILFWMDDNISDEMSYKTLNNDYSQIHAYNTVSQKNNLLHISIMAVTEDQAQYVTVGYFIKFCLLTRKWIPPDVSGDLEYCTKMSFLRLIGKLYSPIQLRCILYATKVVIYYTGCPQSFATSVFFHSIFSLFEL